MLKQIKDMAHRPIRSVDFSDAIIQKTTQILQRVRQQKDKALLDYTAQFDGVNLASLTLDPALITQQATKCTIKAEIDLAYENIMAFHQAQKPQDVSLTRDGVNLRLRYLPIERVGLYVPGGKALYPSTVLMNGIAARAAGVKDLVMVTPVKEKLDPAIAYAAEKLGITTIHPVGGAQAIAALAYGTESIQKVDMICGPGNAYVAFAKRLVYGVVAIDMVAGPSEILVVADKTANPEFVASDLLSQAEHDPMAMAALISTSQTLVDQVNLALERQLASLPKKEIAKKSLQDFGFALVVKNKQEAIVAANELASEHLELMVAEPELWIDDLVNAGSLFVGEYTCESIGDYVGGTNHVLPTNGTARFASALGTPSFMKRSTVLTYTKQQLEKEGEAIIKMAEAEGLEGHARAVKVRL